MAWFTSFSSQNLAERFKEIKTYAYLAFDQLDEDRSGFVTDEELQTAMSSQQVNDREKSFITFLLNNREAISDSFDEGPMQDPEGISRQDLEQYFNMIVHLLEG